MTAPSTIEIRHFHLFCGLGGGARGFNRGEARVGSLQARFRCLGGIDCDAAAIRDFTRLSGVPGTVRDLFDREQYAAFHGQEPPADWREAGPDDIRSAAGNERPHIVFLSAPCKGFSGLLSESKSGTDRYQALNRLTVRGVWLMLEAWADDPPELVVFENVPRIQTRGRHLLDSIGALLRSYGYAVAETAHDCGELGGLAQSRKRFLLVARHTAKIPTFLYEPVKHPLRAVGDVLSRLPMPCTGQGGPMHRMPSLQWKTWVRLAFVKAGSDWRSLSGLRVEDGLLADYGIAPVDTWRDGTLGVLPWDRPAGVIIGNAIPTAGRFSVADPRAVEAMRGDCLGVMGWDDSSGTVTSRGFPMNGRFSVADPRFQGQEYGQYGVREWGEACGTISGQSAPGGGRFSVADPRMVESRNRHFNLYRITGWDEAAGCVTGASHAANGRLSVADPRPRGQIHGKYAVVPFDRPAGTVISGSTTGQGAFAVADPRTPWNTKGKATYRTQANFGVLPWSSPSGAVTGFGQHDNGAFSVADPRLPEPTDKIVAIIRALDGTWHRPFTTLELAALQGLVDPEEQLELDGLSDSSWRERIGNAVPPPAAQAIAGVMGTTLLLAMSGETFSMSAMPIWVRPVVAGMMAAQGEGL
jgi:site-specific DNA-cytosine methylase